MEIEGMDVQPSGFGFIQAIDDGLSGNALIISLAREVLFLRCRDEPDVSQLRDHDAAVEGRDTESVHKPSCPVIELRKDCRTGCAAGRCLLLLTGISLINLKSGKHRRLKDTIHAMKTLLRARCLPVAISQAQLDPSILP